MPNPLPQARAASEALTKNTYYSEKLCTERWLKWKGYAGHCRDLLLIALRFLWAFCPRTWLIDQRSVLRRS